VSTLEDSFSLVYEAEYPRVRNYCAKRVGPSACEDLAQDTFLKAWRAWPSYQDRGFPVVAWILRIAHNAVANYYRDARATSELADVHFIPITLEHEVEARLELDRIAALVRGFPVAQRRALSRVANGERPRGEEAFKAALHRARVHLMAASA
jgi:RNA polymerase sigma-70 factor (ECF subfamily)